MTENKTGISVTWKHVVGISTVLAGIATVHALIVMPSILHKAYEQTSKYVNQEIHEHLDNPHPGAMTKDSAAVQFNFLKERIDRFEQYTKERFDKLEKQLESR
jgi:hypothetical protein